MDIEEHEHLKQLRCEHVKQLRILELKQARMGVHTPEYIPIEIDELSAKIAAIDVQVNGAGVIPAASSGSSQMAQIEVVFKGDFSSLTPELQRAMIRAVAALAEIPPEQVQVLKVMSGSIILRVAMSNEAAERLLELYRSKNPAIQDVDIIDIRQGQAPEPQMWTYSEPSTLQVEEIARRILEDLLERMDIHGYVTAVHSTVPGQKGEPEDTITLYVEGADEEAMGLLIGRRGETLRSLQFMVNLLVSRKVQKWPQVVVDVGHYRQWRQESLEGLARRMAERVRQSGRPLTLEPMGAYERRIVRLALLSDPTVDIESSGEGETQSIIIRPSQSA